MAETEPQPAATGLDRPGSGAFFRGEALRGPGTASKAARASSRIAMTVPVIFHAASWSCC
jgi:hypothetical protein